jgi:hypothetical protein
MSSPSCFSSKTVSVELDPARLAEIERRLRELPYGELHVVMHQGKVQELKTIKRERFQP